MMTSVCCPVCRADVGSVPPGTIGQVAAQVLTETHCAARHPEGRRVVCAACRTHYATINPTLPEAAQLAHSDALAQWHAPHCTAPLYEHQAALELIQAVEALEVWMRAPQD
jgi:hypothetical protein